MVVEIDTCLIWGPGYKAFGTIDGDPQPDLAVVTESDRAGGGYRVPLDVRPWIDDLSPDQKARLTSWLIDQRRQGEPQPEITKAMVVHAKSKRPLLAHERADRLLQLIANRANSIADDIRIPPENCCSALAWSESIEYKEVYFLLRFLDKNDWLEKGTLESNMFAGGVSVEGYKRVAERTVDVDSSQAFIAMWLDDEMHEARKSGFELGVEDAGYRPFVITRKEHINKIEDEIEAEIRRSRFLVADFTCGRGGARGSVYYEAGFAKGLGMSVIFACRKDKIKELHFDTSHYNHIVWTTPADLRRKLKNRICSVIGEGPEASAGFEKAWGNLPEDLRRPPNPMSR